MNNLIVLTPHTHPEDKSNVKAVQLRDMLLKRATTSMDQPRQLVAAVAQQTSVDVMLKMGTKDSIARATRRRRRGMLPPEPSTRRVSFHKCIWSFVVYGLIVFRWYDYG